jgi:MFS transporter, AAHS family, 4-hydroxybenzoate transporter
MADAAEVQVSHFLDEYGLGSFQIKLIVWSVLLAMIDGYDIGAIAFAAPSLIKEWHVAPKELGLVLSASNIGVLFGSQIFGWIGDRYGRKTALILANLLFGVFTFIAAYSTNLTELSWLRLVAGLGIGGVIPNLVAINAESAPRTMRATLAIIAVGLVPLGGALAGFAAAALVPQYGWQVLFQIGGVVPAVFALAGIVMLPESIKFMALHESQRGKMEALLTAIRPDFKVPPNARFVIEDEKQSPSNNPVYLFGSGLAAITPLTWIMFACNLMGYFFLISWTPTLMGAAHVPPQTAALAGAALQVGGTVGSLALCWWLQKARFLAVAILFVIAVPVVGSIGYVGLSSTAALLAITFLAGTVVLGIQSGINVVGAVIYPTMLRSNGSGWQLGIGRLGAIAGPLVGASFVGLPISELYMWSALPFAAGAIVCFLIYHLNKIRLANLAAQNSVAVKPPESLLVGLGIAAVVLVILPIFDDFFATWFFAAGLICMFFAALGGQNMFVVPSAIIAGVSILPFLLSANSPAMGIMPLELKIILSAILVFLVTLVIISLTVGKPRDA